MSARGRRDGAWTGGGIDVSTDVDPRSAVIRLPSDKFATLTINDQSHFLAAQRFVESDCAAAAGFEFTPGDNSADPVYDMSEYFGVWTEDMASRFAFVAPMTTADLRANHITVEGDLSSSTAKTLGTAVGDLTPA